MENNDMKLGTRAINRELALLICIESEPYGKSRNDIFKKLNETFVSTEREIRVALDDLISNGFVKRLYISSKDEFIYSATAKGCKCIASDPLERFGIKVASLPLHELEVLTKESDKEFKRRLNLALRGDEYQYDEFKKNFPLIGNISNKE